MIPSREDLVALLGTNDLNQLNPQQLLTNDIVALSQVSPNIATTNVDPNQGFVELPTVLPDTTNIIDTSCAAFALRSTPTSCPKQ